MTEQVVSTVQCADLSQHPAVRVWLGLDSNHIAPKRISALKQRHKMSSKSAVYRLEGADKLGRAVVAKRCRPWSGLLELRLYTDILPSLGVRTPRCRGWVRERGAEYGWLIMDDVGDRSYSPLSDRQRRDLGRWLGRLQLRAADSEAIRSLPERGVDHYQARFQRLKKGFTAVQRRTDLTQSERAKIQSHIRHFETLSYHWCNLEEICSNLPKTLVHGDLVSKNLRIGSRAAREQIIALDWENAGYGCPAVDLAQSPDLASLPDFAASPDLDSYYSTVRVHWKTPATENLARIAGVGTIFRCIDALVWEVDRLVADGYLPRCMPRMESFSTVLAGSMRAMRWGA